MGRLSGFRYRDVARKLRALGFAFDRQAAGSHEIWFNPETNRYTTLPNHPGDMPEGTSGNPKAGGYRSRGLSEDLSRRP
jgi:predicted RNA binding protein YcfA (HicA-like mRNA interferase family)